MRATSGPGRQSWAMPGHKGRSFKRDVGEWIEVRRGELGLTLDELSKQSGVSKRAIQNAIGGATELSARLRPGLEAALDWPAGSLTAAYRRGTSPPSAEAETSSIDPQFSDTLISQEISDLLNHPGLDEEMRARMITRLHILQKEFAQEARTWLGLDKSESARKDEV